VRILSICNDAGHFLLGGTMQIEGIGVFGRSGVFKNLETVRPWGYFGLYSDNEICTTKILYVIKNHALSMQVHQKRDQFYLLIDPMTVQYSTIPVPKEILHDREVLKRFAEEFVVTVKGKEGDMFGFERGIIHRLMYEPPKKSKRYYGRCLDLAFGENDETDIIRINDYYGRK